MAFTGADRHTIRIEVVGAGRHPMVAIDEFVVEGEPSTIRVPASAESPL
jgi:hypothetical protein